VPGAPGPAVGGPSENPRSDPAPSNTPIRSGVICGQGGDRDRGPEVGGRPVFGFFIDTKCHHDRVRGRVGRGVR
jgi:hypothetical protein